MYGAILDSLIKFVFLMLDGNKIKITNKTTNPLNKPNRTPKNLSTPNAPDHFINLDMNLIKNPPRTMDTRKIEMYDKIFDTSSAYKFINFGVTI